jgi:hypothetical protein
VHVWNIGIKNIDPSGMEVDEKLQGQEVFVHHCLKLSETKLVQDQYQTGAGPVPDWHRTSTRLTVEP